MNTPQHSKTLTLHQQRMSKLTPEQLENYRARRKLAAQRRVANETPEQREKRLEQKFLAQQQK